MDSITNGLSRAGNYLTTIGISDFVDIMTVYKGYSIEFVMYPNPTAANQSLSDKQVQMCIDFLSNLDFVETK